MKFGQAQVIIDEINKSQAHVQYKGFPQWILFNKARYFEMTISDHALLVSISKAAKVKIKYGDMLIGTPEQLKAVSKALIKRGIRVRIRLDWI